VSSARAQAQLAAPRPNPPEIDRLRAAALAAPNDADAWGRYGRALMDEDRLDDRLRASKALRHAIDLAPDDVDLRLALADLYYRQNYLTLARRQLQAALSRDKNSAPAYSKLGRLAMRDWRKFQRRESLELARHYWQDGARRAPTDAGPWLGLGVIALLDRDALGALSAGRQVLASCTNVTPQNEGEALLLVGAGAYGVNRPAMADSAFTAALAHLTGPVRDHLTDISPAASDADTAAFNALSSSGARAQFLDRFWKARDPDLTTPFNEARLEFLSRGTLAYFLYFDPRHHAWDERGWYLVRYGMPDSSEYNPLYGINEQVGTPAGTTNRLLWTYKSLGFSVLLEDRYLNETYDLPISMEQEVDYVPNPDSLARLVKQGGYEQAGRGVVHRVMPGQHGLPGFARVGLFRSVQGFDPQASVAPAGAPASARVEAWLSVEGTDVAEDLGGEAVVLRDSTFEEVARAPSLSPALCMSDTVGVMQFNFDLPPGKYVVGLAARDSVHRASGNWRVPVEVTAAASGRLEVSDLELACGVDPGKRNSPFAKTDYAVVPNPGSRAPRDQPFGFYFEVYNLVSDEHGVGKVSIEYQIQSVRKDRRPFIFKIVNPRKNDPVVNVAKVDDVPGRARFQYVSANLKDESPGPYRIDVTVTDLASNAVVKKSLDFELVE
jgi:GWxTD domain-containing protein